MKPTSSNPVAAQGAAFAATMPPSLRSAVILTAIYVVVHLYNLAAMNLAISEVLHMGRSGTTTIAPQAHDGRQIRLDHTWAKARACTGSPVAVTVDAHNLVLPVEALSQIVVSDTYATERNGDGWLRIPDTLGCPGKPLDADSIRIRPATDEIDALILWGEAGPSSSNTDVARRLVATRSHSDCRMQNGLRRCPLDPIGLDRIEVIYGDPSQAMRSGLPLHAVCRSHPSHGGCEITDIRSDGIGYRALTGDALSSATIQRIDAWIQTWIDHHLTTPYQAAGIAL